MAGQLQQPSTWNCPFRSRLSWDAGPQRGKTVVKAQNEANLKFMDLEKKSKTSYAKFFRAWRRRQRVGDLRQRLSSGQSSLVSYFLERDPLLPLTGKTALKVEQGRTRTASVKMASS